MAEIIPAILAQDTIDLETKLKGLPPEAKFVHLDVLEGDTWTKKFNRRFEVHIMASRALELVDKWRERGAERIIIHTLGIETDRVRGEVEIGLALELGVSLEEVARARERIDFIHLMSIAKIGAQGRPFESAVFDRIKLVKEKFPNLAVSVDGGIKVENFRELEKVGAERLVVGSGFKELWNSQTRE